MNEASLVGTAGYRTDSYSAEPLRDIPVLSESFSMLEEVPFRPTYRHAWPLIPGLGMFAAVAYLVGLIVQNNENVGLNHEQYIDQNILAEQCPSVAYPVPWKELNRKLHDCRRHEYYDPLHDICGVCPKPEPTDRVFAVYWESQKDCARLVEEINTRYITHVYWAFATVNTNGEVSQSLQYWDDTAVMNCMATLRMRCIKQLVSIGGADCRNNFYSLKEPEAMTRFIDGALSIVKRFDFDGIDIDDETGNQKQANWDWNKNQGPTVISYLTKLRQSLDSMQKPDEPRYLLTWDEFPSSFDHAIGGYAGCSFSAVNAGPNGDDGWHRCFSAGITPLVDWVNIMLYNLPSAGDYSDTMNNRIPNWWVPTIPTNKLVIGACSGLGCVEPLPPSNQMYNAAYNGSVLYKGCMLWSATFDILYESANALKVMGSAGNYGVKMPFYTLDL
ncbi:hypothetical protein THRCLA_05121 [Thraustotheca clavata]|uniref:GH18 domain-containing protein n=1 Tax=Thraustotheca clavata TaxID=74557 RepID=A0A1V9ZX28_9STRA|nr:hypothetical protein THRCLA_05121 [Thraustotheca clavata]